MLELEPRTSCVMGKCFTTGLCPSPVLFKIRKGAVKLRHSDVHLESQLFRRLRQESHEFVSSFCKLATLCLKIKF